MEFCISHKHSSGDKSVNHILISKAVGWRDLGEERLSLGIGGLEEGGIGLRQPWLSTWDKDPRSAELRPGKQDFRGGNQHSKDNFTSQGYFGQPWQSSRCFVLGKAALVMGQMKNCLEHLDCLASPPLTACTKEGQTWWSILEPWSMGQEDGCPVWDSISPSYPPPTNTQTPTQSWSPTSLLPSQPFSNGSCVWETGSFLPCPQKESVWWQNWCSKYV